MGSNDAIAQSLMELLSARGVKVPEHLTLVGFDDTNREHNQFLTSYNHNIPAAAGAMLTHVVHWSPVKRRLSATPVVEMPGYVVPRRSSAPAMPST